MTQVKLFLAGRRTLHALQSQAGNIALFPINQTPCMLPGKIGQLGNEYYEPGLGNESRNFQACIVLVPSIIGSARVHIA